MLIVLVLSALLQRFLWKWFLRKPSLLLSMIPLRHLGPARLLSRSPRSVLAPARITRRAAAIVASHRRPLPDRSQSGYRPREKVSLDRECDNSIIACLSNSLAAVLPAACDTSKPYVWREAYLTLVNPKTVQFALVLEIGNYS